MGVPTVAIVTKPFEANAAMMAKLVGAPGYPLVVLPHPVSSLMPEEIDTLMRDSLPQILSLLLAPPNP